MFLSKFFKYFGAICIILALTLLYQRNNPERVAFKSTPIKQAVNNKVKKINPARLIIEKQNINLPIIPSKVFGQKWETTAEGVSWLDISPIPGEVGNSILYGHNWTNLLGNLIFVKPGMKIKIIYQDGSEKQFMVETTAMVAPDDISVLSQTDQRVITIYTCAGLFDEKRYVVVGQLLQELTKK